MKFAQESLETVLQSLKTSKKGLTQASAASRLHTYGNNTLPSTSKPSVILIFLSQFTSLIVIVLLVAGGISYFLQEVVDAIAIWLILIINAGIGFWQEYKAAITLESIKKYETSETKVIRNGKLMSIDSQEIVPGDIVEYAQGDKISADCRVIEVSKLRVDESILTGESMSVKKQTEPVKANGDLIHNLSDIIFKGTSVVEGSVRGVVVRTGTQTRFGQIADSLTQHRKIETNLQKRLRKLSFYLALVGIAAIVIVLIIGVLSGSELADIFILALSLGVSSIPEGLPIITTIALALGIQRMAVKAALVRKLPAVETLSSVDIICVDKTGTLTKNDMQVTQIALQSEPGSERYKSERVVIKQISALCSDAGFNVGNQTEVALTKHFFAGDSDLQEFRGGFNRLDEIPFSSDIKYMATLDQKFDERFIHVKGAFERILNFISRVQRGNDIEVLSSEDKEHLLEQERNFASKGFRILACAYKRTSVDKLDSSKLNDLVFVGFMVIADPPREDVVAAIKETKKAGIDLIMITGDQKLTAINIAHEVGLIDEHDSNAIGGNELKKLNTSELQKRCTETKVFYRIEPDQKLQILHALQTEDKHVAMTGDGVNDALALKEANIGLAMNSGTDVAKDVSDVILLDNNFSPIPRAVAEGRLIFFNIKKFLVLLLSTNFDEIVIVMLSLIFHFPFPFAPIHILWLNLVSDGLPSIALANDKPSTDLMAKKPRQFRDLLGHIWKLILIVAIIDLIATASIFFIGYYYLGYELIHAQTMTVVATTFLELGITFSIRSRRFSIKKMLNNRFLNAIILFTFVIQLIVIATPLTQSALKFTMLNLSDWLYVAGIPVLLILIFELYKKFRIKEFIV